MARLVRVILTLATLVIAHQLVFLVRYGSIYGEALAHVGHGQAWNDAVTTVTGGGIALAAFALLGLVRLARQVRRAAEPAGASGPIDRVELLAIAQRAVRRAAVLTTVVVAMLTVQENLEHAAAGFGLPGLGILLSPEYPFAVWIVAGVALAVAIVATLVGWRRAVLIARLRDLAERPRRRRVAAAMPRPVTGPRRPRSGVAARQLGLRAPPASLPA